jgi:hypothetical protein
MKRKDNNMATTSPKEDFMALVQLHERAWGMETYTGRPDLAAILQTSVAAFWSPSEPKSDPHFDKRGKLVEKSKSDDRMTITLHNDLKEIEDHLAKLVLRSTLKPPTHRLMRIFVKGREMRIKAIHVDFEPVE